MTSRLWLLVCVSLALLTGFAAASPLQWYAALPSHVHVPAFPADNRLNAAKVALGRRLFYDADLSIDGTMACAICHEQHRGFADGNATHAGVHGEATRRNVPGLANVAWLPSYTWGDPRIRTLEAQVLVPVLGINPIEMGMRGQEGEIATRLKRNPCYRTMFAAAFPETEGRIDMPAIAKALAAFERTLVSYDAPYDRARSGGPPLDAAAKRGEVLFKRHCASCHSGPNFTDGKFHRILPITVGDTGLAEVTGNAGDEGRFRTPGLRNVAVTEPYFHDGSARTLPDAIARHPGRRSAQRVSELSAFLTTLTDEPFLSNPSFSLPADACGKRL